VSISERQGQRLGLKAGSQWSPYLEKCCLLVSANESYQRAAEDIATLTGITVSSSTQQRLVHRQGWAAPEVDCGVKEMSLDGGKVRLRTPLGEPSVWRDYKAINLHQCAVSAYFQDNEGLLDWVNQQPLASPLVCLGDGHDGIWKVFAQLDGSIDLFRNNKEVENGVVGNCFHCDEPELLQPANSLDARASTGG
jgi:hypothetical protein